MRKDRSVYFKNKRVALLALGKCGTHPDEDLISGESRCLKCRENAEKSILVAKAAGICLAHRRDRIPALPGKTVCRVCLWDKAEKFMFRKFHLTIEEYAWMEYHQDRKCAICQRESLKKALAVDHDHKTGEIRGLLCDKCNRELGFLEKFNLFGKFSEYIRKAVIVLL